MSGWIKPIIAAGALLASIHPIMAADPASERPAEMTCQLFAELVGTNAPKFSVYAAWLQGVAEREGVTGRDVNRDMLVLMGDCRAHPDLALASAAARRLALPQSAVQP